MLVIGHRGDVNFSFVHTFTPNNQVGNMIRRFNLIKAAEPESAGTKDRGYRCHSDDDEFVWKTLRGGDGADIVWESLSSLTLRDKNVQSSSKKRRFYPFMMLHASQKTSRSHPTLCSTIPSLREHPIPPSSRLLSATQDYLAFKAIMEGFQYMLPALMLRLPTSSPNVSASIPKPLQPRTTMAKLHFTSCANRMQRAAILYPCPRMPLKGA